MQRREDKKNLYHRGFARVACVSAMMVIIVGCSGCTKKDELVFSLQNEQQGTETEEQGAESSVQVQTQVPEPAEICVHVCGAVNRPGVYELPIGSRVYEAIQAAGGFADNADRDYVNQAQQLTDAVQLVIPTVEQVAALEQDIGQADAGTDNVGTDDGKININTASEAQLCDIPGIGSVRASAIAAYRQEHGAFESIEDIMQVSGIKQGTYDKIKDSIKVN